METRKKEKSICTRIFKCLEAVVSNIKKMSQEHTNEDKLGGDIEQGH